MCFSYNMIAGLWRGFVMKLQEWPEKCFMYLIHSFLIKSNLIFILPITYPFTESTARILFILLFIFSACRKATYVTGKQHNLHILSSDIMFSTHLHRKVTYIYLLDKTWLTSCELQSFWNILYSIKHFYIVLERYIQKWIWRIFEWRCKNSGVH